MKKATMQDIADQLNLSRNTVSRAIRGKSGVNESTRIQIYKMAEELGYEYKKNKDILENERGNYILLASTFALSQVSFFGIIIEALKSILSDKGQSLEIMEVSNGSETKSTEMTLSKLSKRKDIDGIFILSHITNEFINQVIKLNYPTVLIDHHAPTLKADAVLTQNEFGTYEIVQHLVDKGHKKIGFIGNTQFSPSYRERLLGFKQVLIDNDLKIIDEYILSDVEEEQKSLFSKIEKLESLPEAWFCVNSGLAFILNTYLHSKGFEVPEDYSIVCFDDTEFTKRSSPPITCIGTDLNSMAESAVYLMQERVRYPSKDINEIRILPRLHERSSVKNK